MRRRGSTVRARGARSCASRCRCCDPRILVVLVLRTIEAFKVFDIIYVMTGGGPVNGTESIAFYTYEQAFSNEFFGYGAALSYLMVLFILGARDRLHAAAAQRAGALS